MKVCVKCEENKSLEEFYKNKDGKDGLYSRCKDCVKLCRRNYYMVNLKKIKVREENYRVENAEKIRIRKAMYYQENVDHIKLMRIDYAKRNKNKICAISAKYKASKILRTPRWLTKEQLKEIDSFYGLSYNLSKISGILYDVDHIIPLRGKDVCGLHVPWNLQVIPAKGVGGNRSKSNKVDI